jgi:hypothetical protein
MAQRATFVGLDSSKELRASLIFIYALGCKFLTPENRGNVLKPGDKSCVCFR